MTKINKKARVLLAFFIVSFFLSFSASAQQISFYPKEKYGKTEYSYRWQDMYGRLQQLSFMLDDYDVGQAQRKSQPLSDEQVRARVLDEIYPMIERYQRNGVSVQVIPRGSQLQFYVSSESNYKSNSALKRLERAYQMAYEKVLKEFGYKLEEENGQLVLISDYQNIAKNQYDEFRPVAQALSRGASGDKRAKFNYVLNFLQSIPYATPHRNAGAYQIQFNSPVSLIENNRGDCDEKSLAFGAVVRRMSMATSVYLVLIQNHALIAVDMHPDAGDMYVEEKGRKLVLAEPTGPNMMPLGQITEYSRAEISAGRYKLMALPNLY